MATKKKEEAVKEPTKYFKATLVALDSHCERRGIIEVDAVRAEIAEAFGKPLEEMEDYELRKVNRELGEFLTAYLGGAKRREMVAPTEDPSAAASSGSVSIGE